MIDNDHWYEFLIGQVEFLPQTYRHSRQEFACFGQTQTNAWKVVWACWLFLIIIIAIVIIAIVIITIIIITYSILWAGCPVCSDNLCSCNCWSQCACTAQSGELVSYTFESSWVWAIFHFMSPGVQQFQCVPWGRNPPVESLEDTCSGFSALLINIIMPSKKL